MFIVSAREVKKIIYIEFETLAPRKTSTTFRHRTRELEIAECWTLNNFWSKHNSWAAYPNTFTLAFTARLSPNLERPR